MNPENSNVLLFATVLGALLLSAARLPFAAPDWLRWLGPDWALAVVLYWAVIAPRHLGMISVWLFGVLLDVLHSDLLGLHGLVFASATFAATRLQTRLGLFSIAQQTGFVLLTAAGAELVRVALRAAATTTTTDFSPFLLVPPLTTAAVFALLVAAFPRVVNQFAQ